MTTKMRPQQVEAKQVADAEAWLDNLDPATTPAKDARHLRAIAALRDAIAESERQLRASVRAARESGDSWSAIGFALGTTRQAAFQRFGNDASPDPLMPYLSELFPELVAALSRHDYAEGERVLAAMKARGESDVWIEGMVQRVRQSEFSPPLVEVRTEIREGVDSTSS